MDLKRIIGQCAPLFFLAVTFDLVGFLLLLVGLAASPRIGDRVYGDFLAITGAILMFYGLGMWVLWYAGNLGADRKRTGFGRIARKLTERVSTVRWRGESGKIQQDEQEMKEEEEQVEEVEQEEEDDGGKSEENAAYTNEAYEPTDNEACALAVYVSVFVCVIVLYVSVFVCAIVCQCVCVCQLCVSMCLCVLVVFVRCVFCVFAVCQCVLAFCVNVA
ncbi:hypothetical protein QTP86_000546 [Hemibagrus guttatus]|nr:hypothetical protein QTP86_000546 [Hemibagrus guttatus]